MTEQLKPLWPDDRALAYLEANWAKYKSKYAVVADLAFEMRDEYEDERRAMWDSNRLLMAELLEAKRMIRRLQLGVTEHMTTDAHYADKTRGRDG